MIVSPTSSTTINPTDR